MAAMVTRRAGITKHGARITKEVWASTRRTATNGCRARSNRASVVSARDQSSSDLEMDLELRSRWRISVSAYGDPSVAVCSVCFIQMC